MRVFISSTCYDPVDLRAEMEVFFRSMGVQPVLSDSLTSDFQVSPDLNSIQTCLAQFLALHEVMVVPSLASARQALASEAFDLVLCDYDLDDGKGDEFVRECRGPARTGQLCLPIIAVSSHEAGNAALMKAGASAVCSKMEFERIGEVIRLLNR
jgi:DNA-binding NarL/FixJ family response regulator